ncbi:MAG TPA: hypothetical protein VK348_03900 [Planctomycetota bacterium]|nr:hypothetical protein [Planctomycetota bacterium]
MQKQLTAILVAATLSCGLTSCFAGPHQLRRSVDDWDHKLYVNSPWIDAVLWVVPVFELANWVAWVGDFIVTDGYTFWFKDAWDGKGTGYEHLKVEATDGKMSSLLMDGSSWLKVTNK